MVALLWLEDGSGAKCFVEVVERRTLGRRLESVKGWAEIIVSKIP